MEDLRAHSNTYECHYHNLQNKIENVSHEKMYAFYTFILACFELTNNNRVTFTR